MFRKADLTCFRQHKDLSVTFDNGVVALRGANEAGKTSLLEAMSYCLFGAEMLRESLADTVTWGHKESELRVVCENEVQGVPYITRRSKSGAEIKDASGKVLATGQKEVKRFWETLLGTNAQTVRQLMLANQGDLRGTLQEDGAAIKLIERLSNFSLIDTIIGLVQTKLPNGTTAPVDARIAHLDVMLAEEVVDETVPLAIAVEEADAAAGIERTTLVEAKARYDGLQPAAREADAVLSAAAQATAKRQRTEQTLVRARDTVAGITPVPGPSEAKLAELRRAAADAQLLSRAIKAKVIFDAPFTPENEWDESYERLEEEISKQKALVAERSANIALIDRTMAGLRAQMITQTACGLCGKDLTNVPEVVTKNAAVEAQARLLQDQREIDQGVHAEAVDMQTALENIRRQHMQRMKQYQDVSEFVTLDHSVIPNRWVWSGPDTTVRASAQPVDNLRAAEAAAAAFQRDQGRLEQAKAALVAAEAAHELAALDEVAALAQVPNATATQALVAEMTSRLYAAEEVVRNASRTAENARQALAAAKAVLAERVKARNGLEDQRKAAVADRAAVVFNNELIKALRDARPDIANELWGLTSASVSKYFSDIRGLPSVFGRTDDGFEVDGHPVKGLSGSTLDSLGLAIRMALTKLFLPNTSFMVLDEPASACDDSRESSMLGVISTGGFDQTIIVSHSDLLDSFATQLVQL